MRGSGVRVTLPAPLFQVSADAEFGISKLRLRIFLSVLDVELDDVVPVFTASGRL